MCNCPNVCWGTRLLKRYLKHFTLAWFKQYFYKPSLYLPCMRGVRKGPQGWQLITSSADNWWPLGLVWQVVDPSVRPNKGQFTQLSRKKQIFTYLVTFNHAHHVFCRLFHNKEDIVSGKKSVAVDFLKCHFFILHKLKSPPLYWSSGIHLRAHESAVWQVKKYVLLLTLKKTQHYWYCCKP